MLPIIWYFRREAKSSEFVETLEFFSVEELVKTQLICNIVGHIWHAIWSILLLLLLLLFCYIYISCYYHHQIGSIHLSHCYHIFRGCVPEMFVTSYSVTYCIYVPGKPGICFHYYCAVYDECKYLDTFCLAGRTRFLYSTPSHDHHYTNLSEGIGLIKCLSDIFSRVCE